MGVRSICATAAALSLAAAAVPAYAGEAPAQFRTAAPQAFSAEDMQRFGLDAEQTARAMDLQAKGYQIVALTPEQAEAYKAGAITQTEWILIGIGVLILLAIT